MEKEDDRSLSEKELRTLKEFVENNLRKSGSLLMDMFGKGDRRFKFDNELVTEADNAAWSLISSKIRGSFEGHGFLREISADELTSDSCPRFLWIVDSLDGAASFQAGMPVWGVSAALFEKFWPVMGFLYLPGNRGTLFCLCRKRSAVERRADHGAGRSRGEQRKRRVGVFSLPSGFYEQFPR